jgi:hypothetical protein
LLKPVFLEWVRRTGGVVEHPQTRIVRLASFPVSRILRAIERIFPAFIFQNLQTPGTASPFIGRKMPFL